MERVHTSLGQLRLRCQFAQRLDRAAVLPLVQQSPGRVAVPAVSVLERRDEFVRRRGAQLRQWPPPSMGPGTMPATRSRVRTIRQGSTGLMRKTFACGPSAAMLSRGLGAARYGLRAR